jgi:hypothetical protein
MAPPKAAARALSHHNHKCGKDLGPENIQIEILTWQVYENPNGNSTYTH